MDIPAAPLMRDIEAFIALFGMSPVTFGRKAVGDPHFVGDLKGRAGRSPRRVWPETEAKVRAFMASYQAQAAA